MYGMFCSRLFHLWECRRDGTGWGTVGGRQSKHEGGGDTDWQFVCVLWGPLTDIHYRLHTFLFFGGLISSTGVDANAKGTLRGWRSGISQGDELCGLFP